MKNKLLRILALAMLLALVVSAIPATAEAKKVSIKGQLLWAGAYGESITVKNAPEGAVVTSVKSSNKSVLKVNQYGDTFDDISVTPKKAGKAKITVKYKVGKNSYSVTSANFTVKKFPKAIKSLKVNGKSVSLTKDKFDYPLFDYAKTKGTITVKAASGWKVSKLVLFPDPDYNPSSTYRKTVKNGKSFNIPSDGSYCVDITMTNKKTNDVFVYHVGFFRNIDD